MKHYRVAYTGGWLVVKARGASRATNFAEHTMGRARGPFSTRVATEREIATALQQGKCHVA